VAWLGETWQVRRGEQVIGEITIDEQDFPWLNGHFHDHSGRAEQPGRRVPPAHRRRPSMVPIQRGTVPHRVNRAIGGCGRHGMSPDFNLSAEIAAAVTAGQGAVRFLARFAAATGRPLNDGDGYPEVEIRQAEQRLGVVLPTALRGLLGLAGRRHDLVRAQDRLLAPHQLSIDSSGAVLQWRVENQGVGWLGIPLEALAQPDPPVLVRGITGPGEAPTWHPFLDRLSLAIVEMLLSEWLFWGNGEDDFADNRELDDEAVRVLDFGFARLPLPDYPMWTPEPGGPTRKWYAGHGAILRNDADTWVWVRAGCEQALGTLREMMPGDWLMVPEQPL
jgi:hypothetical protein